MKHPHYDVLMEWAADTSKVVQGRRSNHDIWVDLVGNPLWSEHTQYRIKPEPKPDVVQLWFMETDKRYIILRDEKANLRLTFDGETGELKKAEVLE